MRLFVTLLLMAAAAAAAEYRPRGSGGAPLFGANVPSLAGVRDEFDTLDVATPGYTFMMGGTYRYSFASGLQLGYYGGGWAFTTGDAFDDGTVKECEIDFGVHHFVAGYKMYFGERVGLFAGGGAGVFQVTYTKRITSAPYSYGNVPFPESITYISELDGLNWSAQAFVGPQFRVLPWLAIGVEAGYFYMNVPAGALKQVGVKAAAAPQLDMSGPFVRVGPMFNY